MQPGDACIEFAAYGVAVDIEIRHRCGGTPCGFPGLVDGVREMLPPGAEARGSGTPPVHVIVVTCGGDQIVVTGPEGGVSTADQLPLALHVVDQTIRSTIAVHAPGLVFIHAGAVAVDGRVIVLPGTSMAGKTTLVAESVRAGAQYLSDEYAVLDADGLVHPFARRLSVREPAGRREVPIAELGGVEVTGPLPVGLVAAVTYRNGAPWQVAPADQAACAGALIANAVAAQVRPAEVLAVAALVARAASFVEGTRGDAVAAVPPLLALATRAGAPSEA